jgi:hypothetical protein
MQDAHGPWLRKVAPSGQGAGILESRLPVNRKHWLSINPTRARLGRMTLFLRALILGYGTAVLAACWLVAAGTPLWAACLAAWIGGNLLALAFCAAGARRWPAKPARASSFTVSEAELRLWDEDLARELIAVDLRRDLAQRAARAAG